MRRSPTSRRRPHAIVGTPRRRGRATSDAQGSCTTSGRLGRLERDLGQAADRYTPARDGAGAAAPVSHRTHAGVRRRPSHRSAPSPSSTTSDSTAPATHVERRARRSTPAGQILAAADTYHAKLEPRPHRGELTPEEAASHLAPRSRPAGSTVTRSRRCSRRRATAVRRTSRRGRAGSRRARSRCCGSRRAGSPTGRSPTGSSISRKTGGNHVEHIYAKIGVSNRARASLFAVRNGLITDEQPDGDV